MITPNYDESISFLERWCPGGPWVLAAIIEPKGPDDNPIVRTFRDTAKVREYLEQYGPNHNIYFTVNPLRADIDKKPARDDVAAMTWLHVDIDPRPGEDITEERKRAMSMLRDPPDGLPKPTVMVFSGGGFQGFWKLSKPYQIDGDASAYESAAGHNRRLELAFSADHCHNVDRIMRLPGTINRPNARKRAKGQVEVLTRVVEWHDDRVYDIALFPPVTPTQGTPRASISISGNVPRLQTVDELPAGVPDLCKTAIVQGTDPDDPKRWRTRSDVLFYVCCQLVRAGCSDDTIYSIITDPDFRISESVLDKGSSSERYATRQIERARDDAIDPNLREINERHAVIGSVGGKCRILSEEKDPILKRDHIAFSTFQDFTNRYCNRKVQIQTATGTSDVQLGKWWISHPNRRQYDTIVFAPGYTIPSAYNLWQGFAFDAKPGDCTIFLDHLKRNICAENEDHYQYLLRWMATAVQHPAQPGHTAVVLRGRMGTGKGVFANTFGALFGRHYMQVGNSKHITGQFNAHLQDCVVLFADEAFNRGDAQDASVLKMLVTEQVRTSEGKGMDVLLKANYLHLIMASNADWVVPVGFDERRFFILDVGRANIRDLPYFEKMEHQMTHGGYEALLYMLTTMDIGEFAVRDMPKTEALTEHKILSYADHEEWWYSKLQEGRIFPSDTCWPAHASPTHLLHDYSSTTRDGELNMTRLGMFLKKCLPVIEKFQLGGQHSICGVDGIFRPSLRPRVYKLPSLQACRQHWDTNFGGPYNWEPIALTEQEKEELEVPF